MYEHENCASEDGNSFERNCGAASVGIDEQELGL